MTVAVSNIVAMPEPVTESVTESVTEVRPLAEAGDIAPASHRLRHWHVGLVLLALTAIGGLLRFYRLTFPALWSDEGLVYWRACGSYLQMLAPLRTDGFPPLHYSLYWLIGHYTKLTPFVMRLTPAVTGTLTIPAMYFLARQMLPRKTTLLAAAFTAFSAFMLFYSRDAKMYPDTWLMVTLNVGCLLWWLRSGHSIAWFGWVAAGCIMVGLHASAMTIVAVSPLLLLTQSRLHWRRAMFMTAGLVLIVAGPIGYFTKFNHWNENVDEAGWGASGIGWVGWFNGTRTGPEHVRYTAAAFLAGWEWPRDDYLPQIDEPLYTGPRTVSVELFVLLGIAALPWPLTWRPPRDLDPPPQPQWRVVFWICSLTLLPAYGYYCHSVNGFFSPLRWCYELYSAMTWLQLALLAASAVGIIVALPTFEHGARMLLGLLQWVLAVVAILALCQAMFYVCYGLAATAEYNHRPWSTVWTPRYLGVVWPGLCLAVAALLMRLPTRALRIGVISFFLGINLVMASLRLIFHTQAPLDRLADDIWAAQPDRAPVRTYVHLTTYDMAVGGESLYTVPGKYYLQMRSNLSPMSPVLLQGSLSKYRLWTDTSPAIIAADVVKNPSLNRLVTWNQIDPKIVNDVDRLSPNLPGWKLVHEDWYPVRIVWDWRLRWNYLRREYEKNGSIRH